MPEPRWYALTVRARQEKAVRARLEERGFPAFLPSRTDRRAWSDRVRLVETAMFPGYLFVRARLDPSARVRLQQVTGTFDLVGRLPGDDRIATPVPDQDIRSLRALVAAERAVDPIERLVKGTRVMVASGVLRGAQGVVETAPDGRRRLTVQVELLGRGVRTVLAADEVVKRIDGLRAA